MSSRIFGYRAYLDLSQRIPKLIYWVAVNILFFGVSSPLIFAQQTKRGDEPKYLYLHGGMSLGFGVISSKDLEEFMSPFDIYNVGGSYSFSLNTGFRNIAQIEYRKCNGAGHNFHHDEPSLTEGGFTIDRTVMKMSYDAWEWLLKINPFFVAYDSRTFATFLIGGVGRTEYLDKKKDGFTEGTESIFGIEVSSIHKSYSLGLSFERHGTTFKRFSITGYEPIEQEFKASYYLLGARFTFGLGI